MRYEVIFKDKPAAMAIAKKVKSHLGNQNRIEDLQKVRTTHYTIEFEGEYILAYIEKIAQDMRARYNVAVLK